MSLETRVTDLERRVSALEGGTSKYYDRPLTRKEWETEYGFAVDDTDWHAYEEKNLGAE